MDSMKSRPTQHDVGRARPTLVTIFADASFCPKTGAAGWGAWAIRDGWGKGRFMGGPIRRQIRNSTEAEICGLASAVHDLHRAKLLADVEAFILQCDNVAALGSIHHRVPWARWAKSCDARDVAAHFRKTKLRDIEAEAIDAIKQITFGHAVWLRHVKGHVSGTGRNWVNQQCDAEAGRHMRAMRLELAGAAA